jgi:hypothetical protein
MPSKLALLAATKPHSGPWIVTDGSEKFVEVLSQGSVEVALECVVDGLPATETITLQPASTVPFPQCRRYRAVRFDSGSPATVRVHFS